MLGKKKKRNYISSEEEVMYKGNYAIPQSWSWKGDEELLIFLDYMDKKGYDLIEYNNEFEIFILKKREHK